MNRILELDKDLKACRNKNYEKRLPSASSARQMSRPAFSHEMAIFTAKGLKDGNVWLNVKAESGKCPTPDDPDNKICPMSRFTRVKDISKRGGREYFTIVDWPHENKKASVKEKSGTGSRFKTVSYEDTGGVVTYNRSKKELTFGSNSSPIKTFMSNPLPPGSYKLRLPDAPHAGGNVYKNLSPYANVWFKIDQSVDNLNRYLHLGRATAGCVTCGEAGNAGGTDDDRKRWTEVYNYLINRRLGGGTKYVGKLKVV